MIDVFILLVLGGIALIFRWLTQQANGTSNEPERRRPGEQAGQSNETDEERIRRFLDALGVPSGTPAPPKVQSRPPAQRRVVAPKTPPAVASKPKRSWVQPLPPLVTAPKEPPPPLVTPAERVLVELPPASLTVSKPPGEPSRAPLVKVTAPGKLALLGPVRRTARDRLLPSHASLRDAIVLREILGPPRGLEAFDAHCL